VVDVIWDLSIQFWQETPFSVQVPFNGLISNSEGRHEVKSNAPQKKSTVTLFIDFIRL